MPRILSSRDAVKSIGGKLGSDKFKKPVTPAEVDGAGSGHEDDGKQPARTRGRRDANDPTDTGSSTTKSDVTRTTRSGSDKSTSTTTSRSDVASQSAAAAAGDSSAAGLGSQASGSLFDRGMYDALGGGRSELFADWGVAPEGYENMEDSNLFNFMWEEQNGNNPNLDSTDIDRYKDQQQLITLFGGGVNGNAWDDLGARTENGGQAGGTHMTYGDVIGMLGSDPAVLEEFGVRDNDHGLINSLILGATDGMYPSYVQDAVASRLNQSSLEYRSALQRGEFNGTYLQWIQNDGTAAWVGGM